MTRRTRRVLTFIALALLAFSVLALFFALEPVPIRSEQTPIAATLITAPAQTAP